MPTLLYVIATTLMLVASLWSGGFQIDKMFLSSGALIISLVTMIFFMIEKGIWIAGAGVFVDEKQGKRLDVLYLKYPLLCLYMRLDFLDNWSSLWWGLRGMSELLRRTVALFATPQDVEFHQNLTYFGGMICIED